MPSLKIFFTIFAKKSDFLEYHPNSLVQQAQEQPPEENAATAKNAEKYTESSIKTTGVKRVFGKRHASDTPISCHFPNINHFVTLSLKSA